jgi:hypothetical protein
MLINDLQQLVLEFQDQLLPSPNSRNQRAYADVIEETACRLAASRFPDQYRAARSVKSTEDFALQHQHRNIYVDVKTRQLDTDLNMPNMISVDKLNRLLGDADTDLYYWMIDYRLVAGAARIVHSELRAVWDLPWSALSIQNLGLGQLQISDWSRINDAGLERSRWHDVLRIEMREFYVRQSRKFLRLAESIA